MFEIPRRGRQARNFECSENSRSQIVFQIDILRKLALGAPGCVECLIKQWFYQKKLRMQKWAVFYLISKHLLNIDSLCTFFMNYWWVWEVWSRCKWTVRFFVRKGIPSKGLFTWSGGPRSSGVGFFCFHALGNTKQKKPTPLDRGPPLHVNRP